MGLELQIREINASRPQCPVGLNTLVLPIKNSSNNNEKTPYVYLNCGHVHGQHSWGKDGVSNTNCTCPMCREVAGGGVVFLAGGGVVFLAGGGVLFLADGGVVFYGV